jgi:ABC-2 type transport system ATP-binding protein
VLVLDEPLNGLDPLARAETIALFRELGREGSHVLISSHILHEVDLISDQVVMMSQGYVVAEGQIRGVRDEISDQPMQVLIRCDKPEYLASQLFGKEQVVEAKLHADRGGLLVRTRSAESFYKLLNHIAVNGIRIEWRLCGSIWRRRSLRSEGFGFTYWRWRRCCRCWATGCS